MAPLWILYFSNTSSHMMLVWPRQSRPRLFKCETLIYCRRLTISPITNIVTPSYMSMVLELNKQTFRYVINGYAIGILCIFWKQTIKITTATIQIAGACNVVKIDVKMEIFSDTCCESILHRRHIRAPGALSRFRGCWPYGQATFFLHN